MKSMLVQLRKLNCVHHTESSSTKREQGRGIIKSKNHVLIEMHLRGIMLTNVIVLGVANVYTSSMPSLNPMKLKDPGLLTTS